MTESNLLCGPSSLDRYIAQGTALPGGGALNMAYHWSTRGLPFQFITRIGDDEPAVFTDFFERHGIHCSPTLTASGPSAAIDIRFGTDRQPQMDNFVEGVWSSFRLAVEEETMVQSATRMHMVLADPVVAELERLGRIGMVGTVDTSGDFLDFRHYDIERFEGTMRWLNTAFIGWPGSIDDPIIAGVRDVVSRARRLAIITLGARGVLVLDGRDGFATYRTIAVNAVEVAGTTVGCGDAFIAAFLDSWWRGSQSTAELDAAVSAGAALGAAATTWLRPLPDSAYGYAAA